MTFRFPAIVILAVLGGCASAPAEVQWQPRTDANLVADLTECRRDAAAMDLRSGASYADERYGAAAAMALVNGKSNPRGEQGVYDAVFETCMIRKGWKKAD